MDKNMTKGSPLLLLLTFSLPLFLGNLFQQIYSMVDTIVVGRFVGVDALAALGAIGGFSFMVVGFAQGLGCGFSVLVSQCYGAGDWNRMRRAYAMSIVASIAVGIVVSLLFFAFSMPLLELVRTPSNIIDMANDYISIIYIGLLASIFYNLFSSILRAVGDSRSPLLFLMISSVLNVVLVKFFSLGVAGVAIATVVSQALSALAVLWCLIHYRNDCRLYLSKLRIHKKQLLRILYIGIPAGIQGSIFSFSNVIIQSSVNSFGNSLGPSLAEAVTSGNAAATSFVSPRSFSRS